MTGKKILLVNGPPDSGKDTVGRLMKELVHDCRTVKMSRPLKCGAAALFYALHGYLEECNGMIPGALLDDAYYEDKKDKPLPRFFNKTFREVLKSLSEDWIKKQFGEDFFGKLLAPKIERMPEQYIVVTDSGFEAEALPLIDAFGVENITLLRLGRVGCNFRKDSRGYIYLPLEVEVHIINNNQGKDQLRTELCEMVEDIWPEA